MFQWTVPEFLDTDRGKLLSPFPSFFGKKSTVAYRAKIDKCISR